MASGRRCFFFGLSVKLTKQVQLSYSIYISSKAIESTVRLYFESIAI